MRIAPFKFSGSLRPVVATVLSASCQVNLFNQARLSQPLNDGLEIGGVLVGQHLAPVCQRIGGVDPNDLPPLFARFVEATGLAVSGGQKHTRGVCLGGPEDPPLEDVFSFPVSLQLII